MFDPASFDVIPWIGGACVGDAHASTIRALVRWLRPGAWLLLGQGYWMTPPPHAYLDATGLAAADLTTEAEMLFPVQAARLEVLARRVSPRTAWDRFADTIHRNHEALAAAHPDAAAIQVRLAAQRRWRDAQQRWGRDVMGFALYALRRPRTRRS